jgi:L-threonylcarbamoyladenylate synthase
MTQVIAVCDTPYDQIVSEAVRVLSEGGLVVFPTETLYGIGADATNQAAVDRLLSYKARREGKPLSIAVSDGGMAREYVEVNSIAENLYTNFLPGPLTVVSKSRGRVARGVASEAGTLGIRIPDYPLVLDIVRAVGRPITATSANASYKKRPYSVQDVFENISQKQKRLIGLVLDAGTLPKREPSTVVDTTLNQEVVLRQGNIKLTDVLTRRTSSPEQTQELGEELLSKYKHYLGYKSVIFALQGELGAGKTEMTKGIARALGIPEAISSPTFIIEKEYTLHFLEGSFADTKAIKLFHIDTWRLSDAQELSDLGFENHVEEGNVFVIEWADKVQDLIESVSGESVIVWVHVVYGNSLTERIVTVSDFLQ